MGLILLVLVALLLLGALPVYGYSRPWGYRPSGILGLILVGLVVLLVIEAIPWGFSRPAYYGTPVQVIDRRPITVINPAPNSGQPVRIVPGTPERPTQ